MSNFRIPRVNFSTINELNVVDSPTNIRVGLSQDVPITTVETMIIEWGSLPQTNRTTINYDVVAKNLTPGVGGSVTIRLYVNDVLVNEQPRTFLANGEPMKDIAVLYNGALAENATIRLTAQASINDQFVLSNCFSGLFEFASKALDVATAGVEQTITGFFDNNPRDVAIGLGKTITVAAILGVIVIVAVA